jgi:hypothetical protein
MDVGVGLEHAVELAREHAARLEGVAQRRPGDLPLGIAEPAAVGGAALEALCSAASNAGAAFCVLRSWILLATSTPYNWSAMTTDSRPVNEPSGRRCTKIESPNALARSVASSYVAALLYRVPGVKCIVLSCSDNSS